ncbi:MAG: alkaline phosphatase family protein [Bacteroidaceae bacterium]|nr:alkaline phosphatase family protein [Bacteroidaceae bacterium]MBR6197696.1 alkaline phosphatase family protein [Bacteroidaceae bacterium]
MRLLTTIIATVAFSSAMAQSNNEVPRLVVGITIDNLRTDYLNAFAPLYGEKGFKKLLTEGQVYSNVQYPSKGIDRASAIATIATGSAPYNHGIIANEWLDRSSLSKKFCVDDKEWQGIETKDCSSPKNLLVSTIGDELKVATSGKCLVYSAAPNREAAILAAGHAADWAIWIDSETGTWAGTSYYGSAPSWMKFLHTTNATSVIENLVWEPLNSYIGTYNYYLTSVQKSFKHKFNDKDLKGNIESFKHSALINEEITKAARSFLTSGNAGLDLVTDYISVCYYAGNYNDLPLSETTTELQDTYARLDKEIAKLLSEIDMLVGLDKVLIYLTSTGYENVQEDPALSQFRVPSGNFTINRCAALLNMYLSAMYGRGQYVDGYFDAQIYLNHQLLEQKQLRLNDVLSNCEDFLFRFEGVGDVYTSQRLTQGAWSQGIGSIRNGYNAKCSGDIIIKPAPGWKLVDEDRRTSKLQRESFFEFPLIFFGNKIKAEKVQTPVTTDCIAPTIAHHIRIRAPNACNTAPLF